MEPVIIDTGIDIGKEENKAPYYVEASSYETKPGCWNYNKVDIIERDSKNIIGSYTRNYSSMYRTFHPFKLRDKWFALYSPNYTATRIMSLPDCKDIGGEESKSNGFCPTDYYVPDLYYYSIEHEDTCERKKLITTGKCTCSKEWSVMSNEKYIVKHISERIHGFVAGCVWGDDSSWKIQYLDLSRAAEGIIIRSDKFGYLELPSNLNLDTAIDLEVEEDYISLKIASQNYYDFESGNSY